MFSLLVSCLCTKLRSNAYPVHYQAHFKLKGGDIRILQKQAFPADRLFHIFDKILNVCHQTSEMTNTNVSIESLNDHLLYVPVQILVCGLPVCEEKDKMHIVSVEIF